MRFFSIFSLLLAPALVPFASAQRVTDLVNPLVGTAAEGQTFPTAGVPFAMTNWTPQTRDGEAKCVAPYYFKDSRIQGFRGSHFPSGSCTQDYGSFTLMPVSGRLKLGAEERSSAFTHTGEQARPQEYSVRLDDYGINASITGTLRSGIMRFQYTRPGRAWVVLQANRRPGKSSGGFHFDPQKNEVTGFNTVYRLYAGSGKPAGFSGHCVIKFDRPILASGHWSADHPSARNADGAGQDLYLGFDVKTGDVLQVRIGTSFTSEDEARRNLRLEIPTWDFDRTVAAAQAQWEESLSAIRIAGDAPERRIFYTSLYHSLLLPRTFSDADGSYPRFADGGRVEKAVGFTYYNDFSIWDTFRTLHPLLTLLEPRREGDMVQSLVAQGAQGGFLSEYPMWNSYTAEMIGDHADAIIADAYFKGVRNFDVKQAYDLMRRNAISSPSPQAYEDGRGRRALRSYLKYGFIPLEDRVLSAFHKDEQVSRTLEYAYDDFLVGRMAHALGKSADEKMFAQHAENWKNVLDPQTGFARGRHADGSWVVPFDPLKPATYVTESTPFHYTFFVPQNIPALIQSLGGNEAFTTKLDKLFSSGLYDQGNEPSHHIAYLYNFAGIPAKTQQRVRTILDSEYHDSPEGLSGNDDCGQMSAWYVMSAVGFYPVTPGIPMYEIGTPRFDDITLRLPNGRSLHIVAKGAEAGAPYIESIQRNGQEFRGHVIDHDQLMTGGELVFKMRRSP